MNNQDQKSYEKPDKDKSIKDPIRHKAQMNPPHHKMIESSVTKDSKNNPKGDNKDEKDK